MGYIASIAPSPSITSMVARLAIGGVVVGWLLASAATAEVARVQGRSKPLPPIAVSITKLDLGTLAAADFGDWPDANSGVRPAMPSILPSLKTMPVTTAVADPY